MAYQENSAGSYPLNEIPVDPVSQSKQRNAVYLDLWGCKCGCDRLYYGGGRGDEYNTNACGLCQSHSVQRYLTTHCSQNVVIAKSSDLNDLHRHEDYYFVYHISHSPGFGVVVTVPTENGGNYGRKDCWAQTGHSRIYKSESEMRFNQFHLGHGIASQLNGGMVIGNTNLCLNCAYKLTGFSLTQSPEEADRFDIPFSPACSWLFAYFKDPTMSFGPVSRTELLSEIKGAIITTAPFFDLSGRMLGGPYCKPIASFQDYIESDQKQLEDLLELYQKSRESEFVRRPVLHRAVSEFFRQGTTNVVNILHAPMSNFVVRVLSPYMIPDLAKIVNLYC